VHPEAPEIENVNDSPVRPTTEDGEMEDERKEPQYILQPHEHGDHLVIRELMQETDRESDEPPQR
jgi:hypothetical protein